MKAPVKVLFASTYPPRACGIGTFTRDLTQNLRKQAAWINPHIAAIDINDDEDIEYGHEVVCRIRNCRQNAYAQFARKVNNSAYDVVCVQHEFGIFPGEWGAGLTEFYTTCTKPIVTTLHTVVPRCLELPRGIVSTIVRRSAVTVVMARIGADILGNDYEIRSGKINVVPHGVPSFKRVGDFAAKRQLGLHGRDVLSTFGLLSCGKGLEFVIAAMPDILKKRPNAVYCILGQTHPVVKKHEGESYREKLQQMVRALDLGDHVRFADKFLSDDELSVFLEATDVYVTPYLGVDQVTSGAMARAVFFGKAIVSTPFLYAIELLANGRGRLVPFKDSAALAREVAAVLSDDALRASMEAGTRSLARGMSWGAVAHKYAAIFSRASAAAKGRVFTAISTVTAAVPPPQRMGQRKSGAATGAAEPVGSGRR